jgi:hypothetical protein
MAIAFFVDNPDGLASAFAGHDEYMAILTFFVRGGNNAKNKEYKALSPDCDECYTAPYCFLPQHNSKHQHSHQQNRHQYPNRFKGEQQQHAGYLIFVPQVPWLTHDNPMTPKTERPHHQAWKYMSTRGHTPPPILGSSVEEFQEKMGLWEEEDIFTFTNNGGYPTIHDISQALGKWDRERRSNTGI